MNTLKVILALASLSLLAAEIHLDNRSCFSKYPEIAKYIKDAENRDVSVYEFMHDPISTSNTCYFKCVMEQYGIYQDGQFDMYKILKILEETLSPEDFQDMRKQVTAIRGKDDCETAYLITKKLAEIGMKYE